MRDKSIALLIEKIKYSIESTNLSSKYHFSSLHVYSYGIKIALFDVNV